MATAVGCLVLLSAATCRAAGFALYEWGAKGNALAGNMAGEKDAEVIAYNPAALGFMDKYSISGGFITINPQGAVSAKNLYTGTTSSTGHTSKIHPIPYFFAGGPIWKNTDFSRLYAGIGVYSRFGLSSQFDDNWDGRYNSYHGQVQSFSITPTIAYRVNKQLSLSFGVEIMHFELGLDQKIDATRILAAAGALPTVAALGLPTTLNDPSTSILDVDAKIKGDATAIGGILGLQWMPSEAFAMAATYRSQVTLNLHGNAVFDPSPTAAALLPGLFYTSGVDGSVNLPESFELGFKVRPTKKFAFGGKMIFTRWSSYDKLQINYDNPTLGVSQTTSQKDWKDSWRYSVAAQYSPVDWLDIYLSYIYDESPVNGDFADYLLTTNDRNTFGIGAGVKFGDGWRMDLNYTYLTQKDRHYTDRQVSDGVLEGEATGNIAHIFGVTLQSTF